MNKTQGKHRGMYPTKQISSKYTDRKTITLYQIEITKNTAEYHNHNRTCFYYFKMHGNLFQSTGMLMFLFRIVIDL